MKWSLLVLLPILWNYGTCQVCVTDSLDLVFILDASTSVTEPNFKRTLQFVQNIVRELDIDSGATRVAILTFSTNTKIQYNLGEISNKAELIDRIREISYDYGSTNTADALVAMRTKIFSTSRDRPKVPNVAILITDGISNINGQRTVTDAEDARAAGIKIYGVGIALTDTSELEQIVSQPVEKYKYSVDDFDKLDEIAKLLLTMDCEGAPETEGPEATIDLYEGIGSNPADIVFLLDTSTSNDVDLYNKIRSFLVHFVESSSVESGEVRFAFVQYSNYPDVKFYLNKYSKKADIITAIRDATFNYGERNTADAFDLLRRQVFTETNGDRPQIPNVVLLVTTGTSDRNSYRTIQEAEALRFAGVGIFVIGIGLTNTRELEEMASRPTRENTFQLGSADELESVRDIAFAQIFTRAEHAFRSPVSGSEQLDLMFLLHFSNNMRKEGLNLVLDFIQNLLEYADIDSGRVRVGISIYRKLATGLYNLDRFSTKAELMEGIKQITTQYKAKAANTAAGLDFVRTDMFVQKAGDRPNVPNAVIIITDANTNINQADAITAAEAVKAAGTAIVSIGIGLENPDELDALATSRDFSLALTQASELNSNIIYLQDRINALKTLADLPSSFPSTTPPSLTTTTTTAHAVVMTIQPPSSVENSKEADIVLAFHSSKKTQVKLFKKSLLKFLADLAQKADIDSGAVRIALVAYGKTPEIIFDFNTYHSSKDLVKAIRKTTKNYRYKEASGFTALDIIQSELFKEDRGDRPNVPNGMILITDSKSNSKAAVQKLALQAKRVGNTKLFAIGLGQDTYEEIAQMASEPVFENTYLLNSYSDLLSSSTDITSKIAKQIKAFNTTAGFHQSFPRSMTVPLKVIVDREEADIVLAFHCSEQTTVNDFKKGLLTLFSELVSSADVDSGAVRFALVGYGKDASVIFDFNSYKRKNEVLKALKKVMPTHRSQEANTLDLILKVNTEIFSASKGDRIGVPNIMIFVTDSSNTAPVTEIGKKAKALKDLGTSVFSIGVQKADPLEINAMASEPSSKYSYTAHNYSEMLNSADLKDKLSKAYPIFEGIGSSSEVSTTKKPGKKTKSTGKTPKKTKGTGKPLTKTKTTARSAVVQDTTTVAYKATALKTDITTNRTVLSSVVKVLETLPYKEALTASAVSEAYTTLPDTREVTPDDHRLSKKQTTVTFLGPSVTPPLSGSEKADIVFAVHLSDTATARGVQSVLNYLNSLISGSDVENGRVQIGLLIYSADAEVIFNINQYRSVPLIRNEILRIATRERSKKVDASAALSVGTQMLDFTYSGRMDAPKALIFVTDRASTENAELIPFERFRVESGQVNVFSVGIGLSGKEELEDLATAPENVLTVSSYSELPATIDDIKRKIFAFRTRDEKTVPEPEKPETTKPELPIRTLAPPRQEGMGITLVPRNHSFINRMNTEPSPAVDCNNIQIDLAIILDTSSSLSREDFQTVKEFAKSLTSLLSIDSGRVRIAVLTFSDDARVEFYLDTFDRKLNIVRAIDKITQRDGNTYTASALRTLRDEIFQLSRGDRPGVPNVAILITDGRSNVKSHETLPEAQKVKDKGIQVYCIGIRLQYVDEIRSIASEPRTSTVFNIGRLSELRDLVNPLFVRICRDCPPSRADIVFVLDGSTSVGADNFKKVIDFAGKVVEFADIDSGEVRVGVITYSDRTRTVFNLKDISLKNDLMEAMKKVVIPFGNTNTADALRDMRLSMFTVANGDRSNSPNYAIVVTDGVSNINQKRTIEEAEHAHREGIRIFAIGISLQNSQELDGIASKPIDENRFNVDDFDKLLELRNDVFPSRCQGKEGETNESVCGKIQLDIVFVLDSSTSVGERNFEEMLRFAKTVISGVDIDSGWIRIGFMTYSSNVYIIFNLNDHTTKADVLNAVEHVKYRLGSTNTAGALRLVRTDMFTPENGDRPNAENLVILITDGISNINSVRTIPEAELTRTKGIRIFTIGIGIAETRELKSIASVPVEKNFAAVQRFEDLSNIQQMLFSSVCPAKCGSAKLDIVFVLDASTSVAERNFNKMKQFAKDLVELGDVDKGMIRFGIVIYGTDVRVQFKLNQYSYQSQIMNSIDEIPYLTGSTNTADALRSLWTDMFTEKNGDRSDAQNIAIVVTDGVSNINNQRTIPEAQRAKVNGVHIYAIGINLEDTREIKAITSEPSSENLYTIDKFDDLTVLKEKLFTSLCREGRSAPVEPEIGAAPGKVISGACSLSKVDLVFILDASTSVTQPNFIKMLDFCKSFLTNADIDSGNVRVGAVIYSTEVSIQFHLNKFSTKAAIFEAIDKIPYIFGSTNTAGGLMTMRTRMFTAANGDRPNVNNIALIITDGISNINARRTVPEAVESRAAGIHIYAIGIGLSDTRELNAIASQPASENSFAIREFRELEGLGDRIFSSLCPTVTTSKPKIIITLPPPEPQTCGLAKVDLVIIMDASTSVTEPNYKKMLAFCKDFLKDADINSGNVRVGIVIYSTEVQIQFHLNRYSTKAAIFDAIDRIPYIYGSTNTADGLNTMRTQMFTPINGDRPDVDNIAMIITDGISNINARRTIPEAVLARAAGIHIYAVGIGLSDTKELNAIASPPASENSFAVKEFDELAGLSATIFSSLCPDIPTTTTRTTTSTTTELTTTTMIPTKATTVKEATPTPESSTCSLAKVDLVLILDASTSVTQPNFLKMLDFCKKFLKDANIDSGDVRVGAVIYSSEVQIQFHLNKLSTKQEVFDAIDSIPYIYGSTNTADALKTMRATMFIAANGDRPDVANVAVIITDGISNINARRTVPEAVEAHVAGIHIYAIGIGLSDTRELDAIASPPASENSFAVKEFDELEGLANRIFSSVCPVITTPSPPATTKTTTLATTTTSTTTTTPSPTPVPVCGLAKVDLVIILDASTSVTEPNYKKMLAFCKDFLKDADIDSGSVRVGVVIYSTEVQIQFHLNRHSTKAAVFQAIDKIPYIYGSTNTADGLKTMRTQMFTPANGDRPDVDNIAMIITDGISNINARRTIPEAEQARASGIHIYAIGIGLSDTKELDAMATSPASENSFAVQDFNELAGLAVKIFSSICPVQTPTPTSQGKTSAPAPLTTTTTQSSTKTLPTTTMTTTRKTTTVSRTTTTLSTTSTRVACDLVKVDLVFILDASTSVTKTNYQKMLTFLKDFLRNVDIDSGSVRVGVVIYSTDVAIQFHLNRYSKKSDLFAAIDKIPYIFGSTNTADGLRTMRTEMFNVANGDRPEVDNVAIIITDGISNINARRTVPEAEQARAVGIHIYAIGIGLTDSRELDAIASQPAKENSFSIKEFDELVGFENKIFTSICQERRTEPPTSKHTTTTSTTTTETTTPSTAEKETVPPPTMPPATPTPMTTTTTIRITTAKPECELSKVDIVFVLDASTSVTEANFVKMLNFVKSFLASADVDNGNVRVGAVIYSTEVSIQFDLNEYSDKASLLKAIDNIPYIYGSTNTADALEAMHYQMFKEDKGDRLDVPNVAVVITDGISNINARRTIPEAEDARAAGIHIYAIGIGLTDDKELRGIASEPADDNTFAVQNFDELAGFERRIFTAICPGETSTALPPAACAEAQVDFVYILDASTSVTQVNFKKMLDFCKQLLAQAEIDNGNVQVGVVVYSTDVKIEFHLNRYKTKSDVLDAVDKIKYIYGSTNTAGGLKTMREEMFSFRNGDRPDVPNVAIILTDGVSNINARRTVPEAEQARAEGIHIYAIGIGLTDTRELNAIASSPASENSFSVKTFDDLKAVEEKVFTSLCPVIRGKQRTTVTKKIATDRTESTSIKVATIQKTSVATTRATTRRPTPIKPTTPKPTPTTTRPTTIKPTTQKPTTPKPTPTTTKSTTLKITTPKPTTPKPTSTTTKSTTPKPTTPRPTTLRPTPATTKSTTKPATPKPTTPKPTPTTTKLTTTQPTTQKPTTPKPTSTTTKSTTPQPTTQKPTTPKPTSTTTKSTTPKSTTPKPTTPKPTSTTTKSTTPAARRDGYDLVMVLDSSVNSTTFNWMMDIARSTIQEISIDDEEWRVGILTYSTSPNREFHLNQYKKKADVLRQLDRVYYRPGQTNTAAALKYARTNMFRESNGDRDFAKNYLMLITGNEKSVDMYAAANEAYQMQRDGVGTYVIGLGINDRTELDELASLPLADYEVIIPAPNQIRETPGQIIYNMRSRSPTPNPPPTRPLRITTTSRPVRPDPLLACKSTGDIVFILDSSGSVGLENFFRVLNFTFNTVDELDMESGNYRVGLVTFSDSARIEFYLNAYTKREEVKNALEKVRYVYGSTHTAAALRRARLELFRAEAGDRQDVPNVVVTITDGNSNVNNEMTLVEADLLKRAGVSLITVAVGFQRQTRELVGLTSAPVEENLIYVDDYKSLDKLSQKLVEPLCTDSDLCRNNPCRNDAVCVDGIRSYMCLCPESYYGSNCEKQCSEPADVAFILDSSNTVGERNFQIMKDYAGSLIQEMNVEACDINIGLMKYSSAPMMQWGLGMHRDTDTNLRAVNQVQYTRGVANMAAALKALRTDIFNGRGGDRPKAKNIAYLLTDGSNMVHEEDTQKNAELAISSGIRIIPVGVSLRDREEVDLIAGAQNLNTIIIDEALGEINEAALAPMVKATDYCAGNPCKNAAKCVNEPYGFTCDCLAGFTGDDCSRRCSAGGDVVFAVDTSRYVTRKEMKHVRRFLRSVVKRLRFKEFKTGLVQYSNTANVILTFADGDKKKNVLSAIAGLRNMPGDPDPAEALAKANFRIFKGDGAMKGEPDYLVLLSKGLKKEEELLTQSNKLKMKGTRILGVGIGLTSSEKELMESVVSYPTSDTVYYADDVERLDDVADKVVEFMCNGQDKCAQNPCQNKGKCHAIGAEYYCDCPLGFAGKNCELKCDAKADIVFLLDSSGSVGHVDFRKVKDFAYRMIDDLNIGKEHTRVGLVAYSSRSRHGFYLKDYYEKYQLQNAISSIGFEYGKTNTADGLRHVREKLFNSLQGDRPDAQNFVVVITDGLSNIKSDQTLVEADLLKANGVHVYAIGIGKFDRYEIDRIASAPASQNAFILEDYASLGTISSDIIRATCKDPSVCDENPCRNDGKCEPTINGPVCKCAGGYRGKYCDMSCVSKKDIIFVLDSSASVGEENFELTLEFVSSVVEELSRGDSDNRYALITFSNDVQLVFSLGRYPSAGIILNAIKYTRYRPGSTNTAGGLRTVLEISSPEYGDRKDVDNIVMLVADGQSNVNAQDTIPAAEDLKKTGAKIVTIGVGLSNYQELEGIASGSDNVYKVNTYNLLDDVKADILESSCSGNG